MAKLRSEQQSPQRTGGYPLRVAVGPTDLLGLGPFSLMRRMTEEMDRMLARSAGGTEEERIAWVPVIEVVEQNGNFVVRAELPGVKSEDVKLEFTNEGIVLQGERKFEQEATEGGIHLTERRYGRFYRSIPLPEGANGEQAKARFDNGVLEIKVPLEQKSQRREIPIEAPSQGAQGVQESHGTQGSQGAHGTPQKG
jgi:HSP20 family protein